MLGLDAVILLAICLHTHLQACGDFFSCACFLFACVFLCSLLYILPLLDNISISDAIAHARARVGRIFYCLEFFLFVRVRAWGECQTILLTLSKWSCSMSFCGLLSSMPSCGLLALMPACWSRWFRVLPVRFFRSFLSFLAVLFFLRWLILLGRFRFSMLPVAFFSSVFFFVCAVPDSQFGYCCAFFRFYVHVCN